MFALHPPPEIAAELPAAGPHPGAEVRLGLGHHYRLDRLLAQATCGDLWQATWRGADEPVVVKTLRASTSGPLPPLAEVLALRREVASLRRLNHPHVVSCRHAGQWQGQPVLVLERLHQSLREHLRRPLSPACAAVWVRQAALALRALHRIGLRHLDLKPANLLLTAPGPLGQRLKLADFGICLPADMAEHALLGTPGWAAPEQLRPTRCGPDGQWLFRTDANADLYALGQLWFRLLTGHLPRFGQRVLRLFLDQGSPAVVEAAAAGALGDGSLGEDDLQELRAAGAGRVPTPHVASAQAAEHLSAPTVDDTPTWQAIAGLPATARRSHSAAASDAWQMASVGAGGSAVFRVESVAQTIAGLCAPDPQARRAAAAAVLDR